jgi:hypothetical protein
VKLRLGTRNHWWIMGLQRKRVRHIATGSPLEVAGSPPTSGVASTSAFHKRSRARLKE